MVEARLKVGGVGVVELKTGRGAGGGISTNLEGEGLICELYLGKIQAALLATAMPGSP